MVDKVNIPRINNRIIFFSKKSKSVDGSQQAFARLLNIKTQYTMSKFPNIKALRVQNGYKQEFLADILGISQPEYSKIENGSRRIDAFMINELCKLYDVKMDVLMRTLPVQVVTDMPMAREHMQTGYSAAVSPELLSKMLDNYATLVDNYLKQQQTTERMMERFFATRLAE